MLGKPRKLESTDLGPCECMAAVEKVVFKGDAEVLHNYLDLRDHPGWRHFMYRMKKEAIEKKRRWDKKALTEADLMQRNKDVSEAMAVLSLIQRLDQNIATLEQVLQKERT